MSRVTERQMSPSSGGRGGLPFPIKIKADARKEFANERVDRIRIGSAKTRVPRGAGGGGCGREGGSSGRPVGAACSRRSAALRGARRSAMGRRATRSAPRVALGGQGRRRWRRQAARAAAPEVSWSGRPAAASARGQGHVGRACHPACAHTGRTLSRAVWPRAPPSASPERRPGLGARRRAGAARGRAPWEPRHLRPLASRKPEKREGRRHQRTRAAWLLPAAAAVRTGTRTKGPRLI